jgi:DNA-binding NarL/FixJ family response regulator
VRTRIILADDHMAIREALRALIEEQADLEVVGEAENGRAAVRLAVERSPDVVLMDVSMPVMNGIEATRRITVKIPGVKVLGLSMHADEKLVREMLQVGASGYVLKDRADKELAEAIRAVTAGRMYLSPEIAGAVAEKRAGQTATKVPPAGPGTAGMP